MAAGRFGLAGGAASYFGLVFAAGFALGTVRTLLLVPHVGERWAELLETPLMLLASWLAARFVTARLTAPTAGRCLCLGAAALGLMLAAEAGVVLAVRGESLAAYAARRDPLAGSVYLLALAFFAACPWWVRPRPAKDRAAP